MKASTISAAPMTDSRTKNRPPQPRLGNHARPGRAEERGGDCAHSKRDDLEAIGSDALERR